MRIATWNINNVNLRLPLLLAWLEATKPDVVALQELKSTTEDFPRRELEHAGYGALVVGQKTWNGVALLARDLEPILVRQTLPGDSTDKRARYVEGCHQRGHRHLDLCAQWKPLARRQVRLQARLV